MKSARFQFSPVKLCAPHPVSAPHAHTATTINPAMQTRRLRRYDGFARQSNIWSWCRSKANLLMGRSMGTGYFPEKHALQ